LDFAAFTQDNHLKRTVLLASKTAGNVVLFYFYLFTFLMQLDEYAASYSSLLSPLLQQILDDTVANHPHHHMLSGREQGLFLQFISRMLRPRRILEIGTFTGFSALCLAKGLAEDGELHTIELRPEDAATAQRFFNQSEQAHQIKLHIGPAQEVIPTLPETWDLVFIDADKTGYIDYYEMVLPLLSPSGILLADNVFFHGQVLQETITGKSAKAIAAFNEHVKRDERTEQVMLTIRDGLMMIRKK
jgi:caffeoyl-CoA O-methyltransferase